MADGDILTAPPPPRPSPHYENQNTIEQEHQRRREPLAKKKRTKGGIRRGISRSADLQYRVDDVPPWYICIPLAFQQYVIMFGATVTNALVVAGVLCMDESASASGAKSELIATIFFASGIGTILQTTLGTRLPIVQGGSFSYVAPIIAILSSPKWKCKDLTAAAITVSPMVSSAGNLTQNVTMYMEEPWLPGLREVQGAVIVASIIHTLFGLSGIIGYILRYIGPLAIAPTISLIGFALFDVAKMYASRQWWITLVTVLLIVAFSQYTKNIDVPCFTFQRGRGCHQTGFALFQLFPIFLAVLIAWLICAILIITKVFPDDRETWAYSNTTKNRMDVLGETAWFRVPYPGQWGMPTISMSSIFGMFAAVLASTFESLGDYYACARMSGLPPPPTHTMNRGIAIEGVGCIIAGLLGSGSAITSYSENIGSIGITKVASRRVIQVCGIMMVLFGVFGKVGALFVTIPDPIVGGVFIVMFGMITAVGISNLQFVDLNSSRNLFIIGFAFFFGLTLPSYLNDNKDAIKTGSDEVDDIIRVLLSTHMFVGGLSGFVLDNTIPGTDEERGLVKWRQQLVSSQGQRGINRTCYDIPFLTALLRRYPTSRYIPFLPSFDENCLQSCCKPKATTVPPPVVAEEDDYMSPV